MIYRQMAFNLAGSVVAGIWAWKTKQKWYIKGAAIISGLMCSKLISTSMVSSKKYKLVSELAQLRQDLNML